MKKTLLYFLILFTFFSCKKNKSKYEDYFPELTMTSVILPDGHLQLNCSIKGEEYWPLTHYGFSYNDSSDVQINDNQVIVNPTSEKAFTHIFPKNFHPNKAYFFKAWVTNEAGYAESNIIEINHVMTTDVTPPCSNANNYFQYGSYTGSTANSPAFSSTNSDGIKFEISCTNSYKIIIQFTETPSTGIYDTNEETSFIFPYNCVIWVSSYNGLNYHTDKVNSNQLVFVNKNIDGTGTIELCGLTTFDNKTLTTKFSF